ncbi:hypothetical protein U9M48_032641 [Paspalum notatum var. saurae]|uniref:F-box domain-containing protein n=1 Tax=Paspalum notatum var. saurae TaxID=547442 RepID=A0AAQ3U568_PASNO
MPPEQAAKRAREEGISGDLLSALPDGLLHAILSFVPAQQAVRTSALSRRWRHLWRTAPCVNIDAAEFGVGTVVRSSDSGFAQKLRQFEDFTNSLLFFRSGTESLDKFRLRVGNDCLRASDGDRWVRRGIMYRPQVLEVLTPGFRAKIFRFPHLGAGAGSCRLKRLHLNGVRLDCHFAEQIKSGCPLLEELELRSCVHMFQEVTSCSLKRLIIDTLGNATRAPFVITAPCLAMHIEESDKFPVFSNTHTLLLGECFLDKCDLYDKSEALGTFLQNAPCLRKLTLQGCMFEEDSSMEGKSVRKSISLPHQGKKTFQCPQLKSVEVIYEVNYDNQLIEFLWGIGRILPYVTVTLTNFLPLLAKTRGEEMPPEQAAKRAREETISGDLLSALPDCLLHAILSFLPAQQAVRTSVLSRRWRHLWRTTPCVNIDAAEFGIGTMAQSGDSGVMQKLRKFESFTISLLLFRSATESLDKFRLCVNRDCLRVCDGHLWVRRGVMYCPQVLEVLVPGFRGQILRFPDLGAGSCRLKRLHLNGLCLNSHFAEQIKSRCPLLEELELRACVHMFQEVTSCSLKRLIIDTLGNATKAPFVITAPCLVYFQMSVSVGCYTNGISVHITDSLLKAFVHLRSLENQRSLLVDLCNVPDLELRGFQTKVCRKRTRGCGSSSTEDRLSSLPDVLLHAILSSLKARQLVQTSVLSRRWRSLWRSVSCLSIDQAEFQSNPGHITQTELAKFEDFGDFLLLRDDVPALDSFCLNMTEGYPVRIDFTRWIRRALNCPLEALHIQSVSYCRVKLPPDLGSSSHCLKRLHLCHVSLGKKFAELINYVCVVLEDLELKECELFRECGHYDNSITSSSLRNLIIDDGFIGGNRMIIAAPHLASLQLIIGLFNMTILLKEMPSLVKASICFKLPPDAINCIDQLKLLSNVLNVTSLELSGLLGFKLNVPGPAIDTNSVHGGPDFGQQHEFKVAKFIVMLNFGTSRCQPELVEVTVLPDAEPVEFPTFKNLRSLLLDQCDLSNNFQLLCHFLQSSPNLEKLTVQCCKLKSTEIVYEDGDNVQELVCFLLVLSDRVLKNTITLTKMQAHSKRKRDHYDDAGDAVYSCLDDDGDDRLSDLPDCLLHEIMSRMKAREVVQTCVLSRRWRHLWRSVPCLDVDQGEFTVAAAAAMGEFTVAAAAMRASWEKFEEFVVILLRKVSIAALDTFRLHITPSFYGDPTARIASGWIRREIKYGGMIPPREGFGSAPWRLKELHLSNVAQLDELFAEHVRSGLPSLQHLELRSCRCEFRAISSDSLKNLVLRGCDSKKFSEIASPTLKSLVIEDGSISCPFVISTPAVAHLSMVVSPYSFGAGVAVHDMASIAKASITTRYIGEYSKQLKGDLFRILRSVCSATCEEAKTFPEFRNLRNVELDGCNLSSAAARTGDRPRSPLQTTTPDAAIWAVRGISISCTAGRRRGPGGRTSLRHLLELLPVSGLVVLRHTLTHCPAACATIRVIGYPSQPLPWSEGEGRKSPRPSASDPRKDNASIILVSKKKGIGSNPIQINKLKRVTI